MNWNKLTNEFKIYIGVIAALWSYIMISMIDQESLTIGQNCICFVVSIMSLIVALKDERTRDDKKTSGWFALGTILWIPLSIAYPIMVSIREKSFNSVFWFTLCAVLAPIFVISFGAAMLGIEI